MAKLRKWVMTLLETDTDTGKTIVIKEFVKSAKSSEIRKTPTKSKKSSYPDKVKQVKTLSEITLGEGGF